jgi:hypothetical protein
MPYVTRQSEMGGQSRCGAVVRLYQTTCFDAGSTELNNPPFSYESQRRVAAPFDTQACSGPIERIV